MSDAIERLAAKQLERVEDAPGTRARAMAAKAPEPYIAKAPKPSGDYEYVLDEGGRVWFGNGSTVEPVPLPRRDADRLAGMVRIRDLARALLALEASPSADERQVESAMRALNDAYDRFVILHGRLSDKRNAKLYSPSEASYYLLAGLEVTDAKGEFVSKADVFTRRVVAAERPPLERAESAADALAYSIDRKGGFDLSYIAGLLGTDEAGALEELGDLAVVDPETGEALMADEYLSGNLAGKREWLESEIGRLKREPEEGRRAAWLAERGLDAVEPEEGPWPDLKKDLAKSGAWASAVNPLAAERYVAVGAVLNGKGFAGRSAGCGMAAVRDLLEESSRSETPADAAMLNFLTPEFEAAGCPPGETAAYGALLASLHAPKSDAAFAAMARMSLDMARAACRAAGIDAPIRIAGDAAARALAEDEALPEYLLEIALEEEPSYYGRRTYLRATPEGLAAFKRQRRTFLESNPREEDEGRVRKLERLLERVRAAMPPELGPADIALTLGSHWVPPKIVHDFAVETFGLPTRNDAVMRGFSVARSDVLGQWRVSCSGTASHVRAAAREAYGTPERSCLDILSSALNSTDLTVTREGRDGERRRDHAATMAAWERRRALVERFKEWAWEDPGRAAELCRIYNSRFNATAPRSYDGSSLTFPGMSSAVELTKHQRDAIARALLAPEGTLIAHVVGAGKTFDGIAAACEARRLGKARKPLVVVPNHLTEQWAADFVRLYPSARILVMGREDMRGAEAVKRFWGRAATGDWDAVIVAQSRFGMVPVSPRRRIAALESRVEEFAQAREAADESGNLPSVKRIEAARKASERKMEQLRAEIDPEGVYFDDLGFDMLVVDEAHNYKNLAVATSISVSGISVSGSQKCEDLLDKCDLIRDTRSRVRVPHRHPGVEQHERALQHAALPRPRAPRIPGDVLVRVVGLHLRRDHRVGGAQAGGHGIPHQAAVRALPQPSGAHGLVPLLRGHQDELGHRARPARVPDRPRGRGGDARAARGCGGARRPRGARAERGGGPRRGQHAQDNGGRAQGGARPEAARPGRGTPTRSTGARWTPAPGRSLPYGARRSGSGDASSCSATRPRPPRGNGTYTRTCASASRPSGCPPPRSHS